MMSQKNKLVVLISNTGTGTNLHAIIEGINNGKINAEICAVISDKNNALGLEHARKHNLKIEICPTKENLLPLLQKLNPDYICLAGWKQIIVNEIINAYPNKILNLHPGLIPDKNNGKIENPDGTSALWNKGMLTTKAIQNFLDKKSSFAGSSIHFLTLNFDFGPVLGRIFEKIEAHDNVESLYARLKKKENELYVKVLEKLTKEKLKILIIGAGGGREHAVGWKIAQSSRAGEIFFASGNAGTAQIGTNLDIEATDTTKLIEFAQKEKIDLSLVVADEPLAMGIVDTFRAVGLRIFGTTKVAAQIESSKVFSKNFMARHNLPTAKFKTFSKSTDAILYLETQTFPIVIKADGLAFGKGVLICQNKKGAQIEIDNILNKDKFGESGKEIVIEEFLNGYEVSTHVFCDGENYKIFPVSQDHKKIGENDTGLNTGGMGTIAPMPLIDEQMKNRIEKEIIVPTLEGFKKDGIKFEGILYPGLMITKDGPKIIEYNARLGDPEAQSYMRLLETDLLDIVDACIDGTLENLEIKWKSISACTIILASSGYPGNYEKGKMITGLPHPDPLLKRRGSPFSFQEKAGDEVVVFHAGTAMKDVEDPEQGRRRVLVTNGGRVLGVSAIGNNLKEALKNAYEAISKIHFEGMQYRRDIGQKSLS